MSEARAREIFQEANAIVMDDHFVYQKGEHGPHYINKDAIYPYTRLLDELAMGLAERFADDNVEVVIAPAIGAISIKDSVARVLTRWRRDRKDVLAVYAERDPNNPGEFVLNRGYDELVKGKRVLAVEDVLNTGDSAGGTIRAVRRSGGEVIGAGALANRGGVTAEKLEVSRLASLLNVDFVKYPPQHCVLCAKKVKINEKLGHGREFMSRLRSSIT